MSFDSFKSSTVGPEALAARIEHEKRLKDQRERDRAFRQRDKERRDYNQAIAAEDSKNYEMSQDGEAARGAPAFTIPKLSRGNSAEVASGNKFQVAANNQSPQANNSAAAKTANGFSLKRF